jgi:flagellar motility protein MotE (MotC chaperone)
VFAQSDCNAIFDARKNEIVYEVDRLDKAKYELQALREATERVLSEKDNALKARERTIDDKLHAIEAERAKIEETLKANEKVLAQINELKDGKLTDLYANMKASNAGEIMNSLDPYLAATILSQLDSKTAAGIIARIEPANAASITSILHNGPPYSRDKNETKSAN